MGLAGLTFAAVDWTSVSTAGAFIVGAVVGVVATIRLVRIVAAMLDEERQKRKRG